MRARRAVYSGRFNSKDERTEDKRVILGVVKGESARRAVASAEVGRGPDVRGAAVRQCGIRMDRGGAQRSM